jgi:sulfur relay protein TusB/DsrH
MANLHIISQAQTTAAFKQQSARLINTHDSLLFIADATMNLCDSAFNKEMQKQLEQNSIYALEADCLSRGIAANIEQFTVKRATNSVKLIDDHKMVKLTLQHQQVISW